jgi:hypothetical protein
VPVEQAAEDVLRLGAISDGDVAGEADVLDGHFEIGGIGSVDDQPRQTCHLGVGHIGRRGHRSGVRLRHYGGRNGGEHRRVGRRIQFGSEVRGGPVIDAGANDEYHRQHREAENHQHIGAAVAEKTAKYWAMHGEVSLSDLALALLCSFAPVTAIERGAS